MAVTRSMKSESTFSSEEKKDESDFPADDLAAGGSDHNIHQAPKHELPLPQSQLDSLSHDKIPRNDVNNNNGMGKNDCEDDNETSNKTSNKTSPQSNTSRSTSSNNNNNSNSSKGKFLVSGGVHPREYAPPQLVFEFAIHLLSNYNIDADITWIVDHTEIHIITHVNPDGRIIAEGVRAAYWRKNVNPGNERDGCSAGEIGVDINRNFDFVWGDTGGASDDPCDESYMGSDAASESETRVLEDYARSIFPAGQQKSDPEDMMDVALGEGISDIYMDVHSYGEYTYYPWGHVDKQSKDNEALEALGRKISSFNGHDLWAPGHDFVYPVSGDTSDYMYGVLGVASYGLEIGDDFYESCNNFESDVLPSNLPALMYAARVAKKPFSLGKGPDVLDLSAVMVDDYYRVTASASDSQLVNIDGYSNFNTGGQTITEVRLYLDVHPDDYDGSSTVWNMEAVDGSFDSSEEKLEVAIFTSSLGISSGRHALFAQARDGDGYLGPVSSVFIEVDQVETLPPTSLPTNKPTMKPTDEPTASPTTNPTETQSYTPSTFPSELVTNPPSPFPTFTITVEPTNSPSASKSKTVCNLFFSNNTIIASSFLLGIFRHYL
mmetsp:Transcript_27153/g.57066  ORF Transcript_27153/g.57066 Transcript_27153/m.57066 type:complete len:605 (+) Transcript_27153:498-2312(+)